MGRLKKYINTGECIAIILVMITTARKYFLLDENYGNDFMITETNIIFWIFEDNIIFYFDLKQKPGYGYSICIDKYPHSVDWD